MAYARLLLLKSAELLNDSTTDNDTIYKLALAQASRMADRATSRTLERTTYTNERYVGDGTDRLYVRNWPVSTLSAVKFWDAGTDTYATENSSYYELIDERYVMYPADGQSSSATYGNFPRGHKLKVGYSAGYQSTSWDTMALTGTFGFPEDLELAVARLAAHLWNTKGVAGVAAESYGPSSVTYTTDRSSSAIPADIMAVFDGYRRVTF